MNLFFLGVWLQHIRIMLNALVLFSPSLFDIAITRIIIRSNSIYG